MSCSKLCTPVLCPVLLRAAATAATTTEEFLAMSSPGIPTRPGNKYPVRESPHFDFCFSIFYLFSIWELGDWDYAHKMFGGSGSISGYSEINSEDSFVFK